MSTVGSSAASFSQVRACARHPDYAAPRFCTGCGATLCTACARHKPHQMCPTCNAQAGKAKSAINVTWLAHLFVDGMVHAWRNTRLRVFLFVLVTGLLAAAGIVALGEGLLTEGGGEGVLLLPMVSLLLGVAFAPALEVPLVDPPPLVTRMARAFFGMVLPSAIFGAVIALPAWVSFALLDADSMGLVVLGVGVLLVTFSGVSTLLAFLYPIQAYVAVRGRSPLGAFRPLLAAGLTSALVLFGTHAVIAMSSLSALDTVVNMVTLATLVDPWLGLAVGWPLCMASGAVMLFAMGAYGAASLRWVEDRLSLR